MPITMSTNSSATASIVSRSRGSFWFMKGLQCRLQSPAWPKMAAPSSYLPSRARRRATNSAICSGRTAASSMKRVLRSLPSRRERIGDAALRTAQILAASSGVTPRRTSAASRSLPVSRALRPAMRACTSSGSSPSISTIRIASVAAGSEAPIPASASRMTSTNVRSSSSTAEGSAFRTSTTAAPALSRLSHRTSAVALSFGTGRILSVASRTSPSVPSDPTMSFARSIVSPTESRRAYPDELRRVLGDRSSIRVR